MATANEQLRDALLKRQSYLQLLARRFGIDFVAKLDGTHRSIRGMLQEELPLIGGALYTKRSDGRFSRIEKEYLKIKQPVYTAYETQYTELMAKLANDEGEFIAKTLQGAIPFDVSLASASPTAINNLTAFGMYDGKKISTWFSDMSESDLSRFSGTIRAAVNNGFGVDQTIDALIGRYYKTTDRYSGTIQSSRYNAETLTRTITNGVSNGAREEFYKANADIIAHEVYLATLDGRTSLICATLDGSKYKVGEGPVPPLHPNCRSLRVAVIDGVGLIGERPSVGGVNFREKARNDYISQQMAKGKSRKEAQAAWNDTSNQFKNTKLNNARKEYGNSVIGSQPADTTYNQFLKKQSPEFQNDVLGKTNAEKYRQGKITLDKLVTGDGRPLTLAELRAKYPDVY